MPRASAPIFRRLSRSVCARYKHCSQHFVTKLSYFARLQLRTFWNSKPELFTPKAVPSHKTSRLLQPPASSRVCACPEGQPFRSRSAKLHGKEASNPCGWGDELFCEGTSGNCSPNLANRIFSSKRMGTGLDAHYLSLDDQPWSSDCS